MPADRTQSGKVEIGMPRTLRMLVPNYREHFIRTDCRAKAPCGIWVDFIDLSKEPKSVLRWKLGWIRDMELHIFWPLVKTWDYHILDIVGIAKRKKERHGP